MQTNDLISRRDMLSGLGLAGLGIVAGSTPMRLAFAQGSRTLRAAITGFTVLNTLDPAITISIAESMIDWGIFNTLVKFDPQMNIVPDLAESWTTPDPNTWVFKLRSGVKFHDGTILAADDVRFSLERMRGTELKSVYRNYLAPVKTIEVLDELTIKLTTDGPYAPLLSYLTNTRTGTQIVPRKVVEAMGNQAFGRNPVGTGPFQFKSFTPGQKVQLAAFRDYFVPGEPKIDGVEVFLIEQETSVVNAMLAGDIDLSSSAPSADVAALAKDPRVVVSRVPGLNLRYVELNNTRAPFDDVHFRRATSMAFDRKALVDIVLFGEGQAANGPVPAALAWAYEASPFAETTFDPDAAVAELKKSKYGKRTKASVLTFGSSWWKRWAEVFVEQVNETLDVDFNVEVVDANTANQRFLANNMQALVWGFLGLVDPDEYTYQVFHKGGARNYRGYSNAELDTLVEQARSELDQAKRGALYRRVQAIVAADCPMLPCFYASQVNLWRPQVEGFVPLPYSGFGSQFAAVDLG